MAESKRHQVATLEAFETRLQLTWADGHVSEFPSIWLLQACACTACGTTESAIRHVRLTDQPARPAICSARVGQSELQVDWGDGHVSHFALPWLRAHCLSAAERARRRPTPRLWGQELLAELPYLDYATVAGEPDQHLLFLETLRDLGFVILRDVPKARERTEEIAAVVGKLRMTNYGIYELEAKPNPEIVADLAVPLELHTDEPYRIDPPGITLFHVLQQSARGGESRLGDGFNLAAMLRDRDPEAFAVLSRQPARFHRNLREGRAFETQAPIISCDRQGHVTGVRLLDRGLAPVDARPEEVEPFYDALRSFLTLLYSGEGRLTIRLESGEMLVFHNQRVLHGRTAFNPGQSHRHVRSCHVDLDEFHSRLRTAYQARGDEAAWMALGPAARS